MYIDIKSSLWLKTYDCLAAVNHQKFYVFRPASSEKGRCFDLLVLHLQLGEKLWGSDDIKRIIHDSSKGLGWCALRRGDWFLERTL